MKKKKNRSGSVSVVVAEDEIFRKPVKARLSYPASKSATFLHREVTKNIRDYGNTTSHSKRQGEHHSFKAFNEGIRHDIGGESVCHYRPNPPLGGSEDWVFALLSKSRWVYRNLRRVHIPEISLLTEYPYIHPISSHNSITPFAGV